MVYNQRQLELRKYVFFKIEVETGGDIITVFKSNLLTKVIFILCVCVCVYVCVCVCVYVCVCVSVSVSVCVCICVH